MDWFGSIILRVRLMNRRSLLSKDWMLILVRTAEILPIAIWEIRSGYYKNKNESWVGLENLLKG